MKFRLTYSDGCSSHIVLLFAGWGMSDRLFADVSSPGYDVAVVWDYRDMSVPWLNAVEKYEEIVVVAWSFGVHAAARFMNEYTHLPVTAVIAVNGTRFTKDNTRGIPCDIFDATLAGLTERSVMKFHMRMCGGASAYKEFSLRSPQREIDDLRDELTVFDAMEAPQMLWDRAYVSRDDLIIPPVNQLRGWSDEAVRTEEIDGSHLPDFNYILRECLTDKSYVAQRFSRAECTYDANASVQKYVAGRLVDILCDYGCAAPAEVLEIGCGTGMLTDMIMSRLHPQHMQLYDLHIPECIHNIVSNYSSIRVSLTDCDAETRIMRERQARYNLVVSASTVQWFNSMRTFLSNMSRVMVSGGVAAISTYGPDTMREIHGVLGTHSRFNSVEEIRRMIPSSFEILDLHDERLVEYFDTPVDVMRHISLTGVNGISRGRSNTKACARLLKEYPLTAEGKAPLTYHPIYIFLRKL